MKKRRRLVISQPMLDQDQLQVQIMGALASLIVHGRKIMLDYTEMVFPILWI